MTNILVCDDEEPFRRLLKNELTRKGYAVSVAADGAEALRQLAASSFDVVLLDVVMPGIITSSRTTSNALAASWRNASAPSAATETA